MAREISVWEQFVRDLASLNRREEMKHVKFNSEGTSYEHPNAEINDDHAACFDCYILEARQLLEKEAKNKPARFKCTGVLSPSNVAYIHQTKNGDWVCTLDNGTPASMFYAVGNCDEMALKFKLQDAETNKERLNILRLIAGGHVTVEQM